MKNLCIVMNLFIILYCPQFGKVNSLYIIGIITWIYILFFYPKALLTMKNRSTQILYISLGCIFLYSLFNSIINLKFTKEMISPVFYWGGIIFPVLYLIINKYYDKQYNNEEKFVKLLLVVGNVQGAIDLFLYLSPNIRYKYLNYLEVKGVVKEGLLEQVSSYRYYGISGSVITYMPIVQVILALLAIWLLVVTRKKEYIIYFPLLIFSSFINARTPIIIFVIGMIMLLLLMNKRGLFYSLKITFVILIFICIFCIVLYRLDTDYSKWFIRGIESLLESFSGKSDYRERTGLIFIRPTDFSIWLFGKGGFIIGENPYGQSTDMGYANYIWLGGLVYVFLLFLIYSIIARRIIQLGASIYIVELLYMAILVFSIKMPVIYDNELMRLFYAIYVWNVVNKHRSKQSVLYSIELKFMNNG